MVIYKTSDKQALQKQNKKFIDIFGLQNVFLNNEAEITALNMVGVSNGSYKIEELL